MQTFLQVVPGSAFLGNVKVHKPIFEHAELLA